MRIISFGSKDALEFIPDMKELLLSGRKEQTIRLPRKKPFSPGEKVQIYWKQRSKNGEKLFNAEITEVIDFNNRYRYPLLAEKDGFLNAKQMFIYLDKVYHDYSGFEVIRFKRLKKTDNDGVRKK